MQTSTKKQETRPERTGIAQDSDSAACPNPTHMGEYACNNRHQCWEPCGELGHSEEHVKVVQEGA